MTPPTIEAYETELDSVKRTCERQQAIIRELQAIAFVALANMESDDYAWKLWVTRLMNRMEDYS